MTGNSFLVACSHHSKTNNGHFSGRKYRSFSFPFLWTYTPVTTSFSFYLTWYCDPLADACHVFKCKYNGLCSALATGTPPLCKCPEEFPVNFNPVCGTDGQTYSNIGEMKYKACREQKIVEVRHVGKCGKECLHLAVVYHVKSAPCLPPSFPFLLAQNDNEDRVFNFELNC